MNATQQQSFLLQQIPKDVLVLAPLARSFALAEGIPAREAFEKAWRFIRAGEEWHSDLVDQDMMASPSLIMTLGTLSLHLGIKVPTLREYAQATMTPHEFDELWGRALKGERVFTPAMVDNLRKERAACRRSQQENAAEGRRQRRQAKRMETERQS